MRARYLSVVVLIVALAVPGRSIGSAAQPSPPTRFFGALTIDGMPAAPGTEVVAEINGKVCSQRKPFPLDVEINYGVDAESSATLSGCGTGDAVVYFRVDSRYAAQTARWVGPDFVRVDLTVSGAGARPFVPDVNTEQVALARGCNNVTLTAPAGEPLERVAGAVTPAGNLESVFLYLNDERRFAGYAPNAPAAVVDYRMVRVPLETVFICVKDEGVFTRPLLPPAAPR